jgi:hypothetical protein
MDDGARSPPVFESATTSKHLVDRWLTTAYVARERIGRGGGEGVVNVASGDARAAVAIAGED